MKKYIVYTDCHKGAGNYEWDGEFDYAENVRFLGDNFEFKNISKKEVAYQKWRLEEHLKKSKEAKALNVASNHGVSVERDLIQAYDILEGNILWAHGHRAVYSKEKCNKWENRKPGIGSFMLMLMRMKRHSFYESKYKAPPIELQKKLSAYARERGASTIVVGHFHQKWDGMHNGIRIIMCGRGRSEIKI